MNCEESGARVVRSVESGHHDSSRTLLEHLSDCGTEGLPDVRPLAERAIENEG